MIAGVLILAIAAAAFLAIAAYVDGYHRGRGRDHAFAASAGWSVKSNSC
jgi:hypothetical protein